MVILFEQELPHYRVPVFSALAERLGETFAVCYSEAPTTADFIQVRASELPFQHLVLNTLSIGKGKLYFQNFFGVARKFTKPSVVIARHSIRNVTLLPLLWFYHRQGIPVVIWGQGYSRNRTFDPRSNWVDKIHLQIVRRADAYICYTKEIYDELSNYVSPEKLFIATNTLNTQLFSAMRSELTAKGKAQVKQELGLERTVYLAFIGRLHPRKRLPYLLEVYEILKKQHKLDIGLLVIGNGNAEPILEQIESAQLDDVHLLGALPDEMANTYLFAADVMVMPGWLGLAVNHAFLFGLPVVSQRSGENFNGHGPEASYVQDGVTGFFSEEGNRHAMADDIMKILKDYSVYERNVLEYAENYLTIEAMTGAFSEAINYAKQAWR